MAPAGPTREFHVSREARDRYGFDEALFGLHGNVVFANYAAARRFAQKMNEQRDLAADPGAAVRAGDISAMGLVDEILHFVVELYQRERNPEAMTAALAALGEAIPPASLEDILRSFAEHFPAIAAYRGALSAEEYLAGETDGTPNREIVLEELLMLWLANGNEGFAPHGELFDDGPLEDTTAYLALIRQLQAWFRTQPGFGPDDEDLVSLLRRPALDGGTTLADQLRWISDKWGFAAEKFGDQLVVNLDVLTEDERAVWMRFNATQGGGADVVARAADADTAGFEGFGDLDSESERFSSDLAWMPRVVLLAKSTYVWLDQLSRANDRPIGRLDQIPDAELDTIAARGFTGLWLIGLWERSVASREIKQLRGNPEAVASAYSLMDYRIADDLGGEEAYANLRDRAWSRGIRLASDMVPNHMGIDSRWVVEHPDWFMQRPDPPYPVYSYSGPNLSNDERVGIYIEDHYFDNTDAAVTFKRADRWSGQERHLYHGNDGTSMPWNDTAQLDYIKPEVREAVIQTILAVARRFPIIRFDAAMTLAKRHIQRLWYPAPGTAGAIPSRAEYSMSKAQFDKLMPQEFWREVVDRVAVEAPDTLLLAEAFWLMEGYFVRTLGMHRVYNSAFMNMMRDEKNGEYRLVIKNTLEFDPQILKRYVNFMNNPDEKTAVDQFGKGDKYFGVATLLATMPGLPMFGHGQIEGFAERYGMEYRRAYLDEMPDPELITRHEREIFPLLHQRALFAEVYQFALYDFFASDGSVNEDVFAYSNRAEGMRSLVVYHNRFDDTAGWIRTAAVTGRSLADGLSLGGGPEDYLVMRDGRTGLLYLRSHAELAEKGLYMELGAYTCHVFVEMHDVHDTDGRYGRLAAYLSGRGVPSLEDAMSELALAPLHAALRDSRLDDALREAAALIGTTPEATPAGEPAAGAPPTAGKPDALAMARAIEALVAKHWPDMAKGRWIYEWLVNRVWPDADLFAILLDRGVGYKPTALPRDERFLRAIGANDHDGATWFNKERFDKSIELLGLARPAELRRAAEKAGYRLDLFEKALAAQPKRAPTPESTRSSPKPKTSKKQAKATAVKVSGRTKRATR
ncbi:MAG: alpha-amylase family glycosyl hydrolase [Candidatus Limnocylindrales bacterium]